MAVVGGLHTASSADVAMQWVRDQMTKVSAEGVVNAYHVGGSGVNGIVNLRFTSLEKRYTAIQKSNAAKVVMSNRTSFMNP